MNVAGSGHDNPIIEQEEGPLVAVLNADVDLRRTVGEIALLPSDLTVDNAARIHKTIGLLINRLMGMRKDAELLIVQRLSTLPEGVTEFLEDGILFRYGSDGWVYPDEQAMLRRLAEYLTEGRITSADFEAAVKVTEVPAHTTISLDSRTISNLIEKRGCTELASLRMRTAPKLTVKSQR